MFVLSYLPFCKLSKPCKIFEVLWAYIVDSLGFLHVIASALESGMSTPNFYKILLAQWASKGRNKNTCYTFGYYTIKTTALQPSVDERC